MRGLILVLGLGLAVVAMANADRWIIEDGLSADGGTYTESSFPTLVHGQTKAALWSTNCTSNACTRAAPSGDFEGIELGACAAWTFSISIDAGTFVDGGTCETWAFNPNGFTGQKWKYVDGKDQTPTSNRQHVVFPAQRNSFAAPGWRMAKRCNAVGTSTAAPKVNTQIHCCLEPGCHP